MKITQTDTQFRVTTSGISQLIIGIVFACVGIALALFGHTIKPGAPGVNASAHADLIVMGMGAVFFAVGVICLRAAGGRETIIERSGQTTLRVHRILGGKTQEQSVATSDITGVRLTSYMDGSGGGGGRRRSTLILVLRDNGLIEVTSKASGGVTINGLNMSSLVMKAPLISEAQQLAAFLGVPLETTDMSSIKGMVDTAREVIDAAQNHQALKSGDATFVRPMDPPTTTPTSPDTPIKN